MTSPDFIRQSIEKAWYGKPGLWRVLWPLARLYQSIARRRQSGLQRDLCHGLPVIVVGNLSVGGTGKTPVVQALVKYLQQAGWRVGLVSRGYGGSAPQYPLWVDPSTPVEHSGDEAALLVQTTGAPMAVAPVRSEAVAMLARQDWCDVVISDDGLQHYAMPRVWEIAVVDGQRGFGNGYCLPLGPLREPLDRLETVDCIWVNGHKADPALPGRSFRLETQALEPLYDAPAASPASLPARKTPVHAIAGIGNPGRFFNTLSTLGFETITHIFPDHHRYQTSDLPEEDGLPLMMTEKDAVKFRALSLPPRGGGYWVLPVRASIQSPDFAADCKAMEQALARFR